MNTYLSRNLRFRQLVVNILSIFVILAMAFPAVGSAYAQEATPHFTAFPVQDYIEGWDWPLGANIHLEIDNPITDADPDFEGDQLVVVTPWNPDDKWVTFNFAGAYDMKPGDVVTLSDGSTSSTYTVENLAVTEVNIKEDAIYGTADIGAVVHVWVHDHAGSEVVLTVNGPYWMANYWELPFDLVEGMCGRSEVRNDRGNATAVDWCYPVPRFTAFPEWDYIEGWEWLHNAFVYLTIDSPDDSDFYTQARVEPTPWNPDSWWVRFNLSGKFDLKAGDVVTLDDDMLMRTMIIKPLAVTEINEVEDTVAGTAYPGEIVTVWPHATGQELQATANSAGSWQVDFTGVFDLVPGVDGRAAIRDSFGNETAVDWRIPKSRMVVFPEWEWFDGLDWPDGAKVTITVANKPECEISKESWDYFFNGSFGENCNIVAGDTVTFDDGTTQRTHTVLNLGITGVDAQTNIVAGTADEGTTVYVWPHATGEQLQVKVGSEGTWQVDFTGTFDLVPGEAGRSQIYDEFENATAVDWNVPWPPSTFIVNTTTDADDGTCDETHCSLREAINVANARSAADTIVFNISGEAPFTIQPRSPLPNIEDQVMLDGTTQPGYDGSPAIELDGTFAGEWVAGLVVAASDSTVKGLAINRYGGDGLVIYGSGNSVQGNYLGTDVTGTTTTGSTSGPEFGGYDVEVEVACRTYDAGTDRDGFVSESADPLAPWSGTSVTFKGTDECGISEPETFEGAPLIYRYRLAFDEPTELASIAVSGAAFNGGALRVLDENRDVLGTVYNFGGNSFQTNYIRLTDVVGQVFFIEEYDFSSDWRYRENLVINGPLPVGNRGSGVLLAGGATNNTVSENLISGNLSNGVAIFNPGTTGNVVQENYIGTDITGSKALGSGAPGVGIGDQAYDNFIIGNLISGNGSDGVAIFNAGTNGNTLEGNKIGTDDGGMFAIPNAGVGVWIGQGALNTQIGGTDASVRNVISGNKWGGISINDLETTGTRITGNYVGTNKNGDVALPNGGDGVYISGSQSIVGGAEPGAGNLISGNIASGVSMAGGATGNIIQSNFIGTDVTGTTPIYSVPGPKFGGYEVEVEVACSTYDAGTDWDGFISESSDPRAPWSGTSVTFKGTDECGIPEPDTFEGTSLIYRYKLTFDEPTELASIAVSGAAFNGGALRVLDENREVLGTAYNFGGNSFQTNYVRLSGVIGQVFFIEEYDFSSTWRYREDIVINGPLPLGNSGSGVNLHDGASDNLILDNLISGNRSDAVSLYHTGTNGNILQGNYIGTDVTGTVALPNTSAAIWIGEGASNTLIGGVGEGEGNIVSGNTGDAISINHAETSGTVIQGNFIGTDVTGTVTIPNLSNGIVLVTGTHNNLIGGTEPGAGNVISGNWGNGVLLVDSGTGNALLSNSVFANGSLGIALGEDGVTPNDPLDHDTGPNNLQNYPIITNVIRIGSSTRIQGLLVSTPGITLRLEFFGNESCDPSASGEGQVFLGFTTVKTNPAGIGRFEITLPVSLPFGHFVTATATDPAGNTSEFSRCFSPRPGWNLVNDGGFGDSSNIGVTALEVFQNKLFASASNWNTGGQLWRLGDDALWYQVMGDGFGNGSDSPAILDFVVFQGQLYTGTGWGAAPGQVWRSMNGNTWQPVTTDGFGTAENIAVTNFVVFQNMLYAGTGSVSGTAQIWRSSTGDNGTWIQVAPDGAASQAGNVTGFAVYKNVLYAAIEPAGGVGAPIQIWRSTNGSDWKTVTSDGFGDERNVSSGGFAQFGGYLYLGTRNDETGAQLWRTKDGLTWGMVVGDGFGDTNNLKIESLLVFNDLLYAVTHNPSMGMQVWRSADGMNWEQVAANGFGDRNNFSTLWNSATVAYQGQLLIGTWNNADGGELWRFTP